MPHPNLRYRTIPHPAALYPTLPYLPPPSPTVLNHHLLYPNTLHPGLPHPYCTPLYPTSLYRTLAYPTTIAHRAVTSPTICYNTAPYLNYLALLDSTLLYPTLPSTT